MITEHAQIAQIQSCYSDAASTETVQFLATHPALVPLLLEAHNVIGQYFPAAPIYLRVATDPETTNEVTLIAAIEPQELPQEAANHFMQFMDNWWLDALDRADDKLTITIEYR
jgi:hypothetical protein